jgi:hypothetical protein
MLARLPRYVNANATSALTGPRLFYGAGTIDPHQNILSLERLRSSWLSEGLRKSRAALTEPSHPPPAPVLAASYGAYARNQNRDDAAPEAG